MTDPNVYHGLCKSCDPPHLFVGMDRSEYLWTVSRHVREVHGGDAMVQDV